MNLTVKIYENWPTFAEVIGKILLCFMRHGVYTGRAEIAP